MKVIDYQFGMTIPYLLKRHFRDMAGALTLRKALNSIAFLVEQKRQPLVCHSKPFYIKVEPTNFCNLNCPNCSTHSDRPKGYMNPSLFNQIIDFVRPYCMRLSLYGQGESLLHPHIFEMIRYAEENRCPVCISSNFCCLSDDGIRKLLDSGLNHIIICVDGGSQETYGQYRRNGDLAKVLHGLKTLSTLRTQGGYKSPVIEVQTAAFKHIRHELASITKTVEELGADIHTIRRDMFDGAGEKGRRSDCKFLWGSIFVAWDGRVYPCEEFVNHHGHVVISFADIKAGKDHWNSDIMIASRRTVKTPSTETKSAALPCEDCIHFPPTTMKRKRGQ